MSSISHGAPQKRRIIPNPGLWLAIIAGIIITLLPLGDTLPVAGQNMIAILVFAIIVWISEAMDYTASAIVISALIIFMVGFAPDMNHPDTILGTTQAVRAVALGTTRLRTMVTTMAPIIMLRLLAPIFDIVNSAMRLSSPVMVIAAAINIAAATSARAELEKPDRVIFSAFAVPRIVSG